MKGAEVYWTEQAKRDLEDIVLFIARESIEVATQKYEELRTAARALTSFAQSGKVVPELEAQNITTYRELTVPPWRIVYRTDRDRVYILAVLDGRRNIEDLLLRRQLR